MPLSKYIVIHIDGELACHDSLDDIGSSYDRCEIREVHRIGVSADATDAALSAIDAWDAENQIEREHIRAESAAGNFI